MCITTAASGQTSNHDASLAALQNLLDAGLDQHPFFYCGEWG